MELTSMQIFDLTNHPYTDFTSHPDYVRAQSIRGFKSEFRRKIIAMEGRQDNLRGSEYYSPYSMVFSFRGYNDGLRCPLRGKAPMARLTSRLKA